jgi:hypothetical protein
MHALFCSEKNEIAKITRTFLRWPATDVVARSNKRLASRIAGTGHLIEMIFLGHGLSWTKAFVRNRAARP